MIDDCALFHGVWAKGAREQVWMSHGDRVTRLPPGFRVVARQRGRAVRRDRRRRAPVLRRAVPSRRWCTRRTARSCCAISPMACWACPAPGPWPASAPREIARIRAQVGSGRVICGLSGGVEFLGRRGADPRGDRRPADLHLRRSRPAAAGRGGGGGRHVPRPVQHQAGASRRVRPVPRRARGRHRSGSEAQDDRPAVHRGVRGGGGARSAAPISWRRARCIRT